MTAMYYDYMETPVGKLLLAGDGERIVEIGFPSGKGARRHSNDWTHDPGLFERVRSELAAYFIGQLRSFSVPLAPQGTRFQLRVWEALRNIPYGDTISYGELASRIGNPAASRAVGAANGRNPIPIIIPCHRVIGANGTLVGFGGGLDTKQKLLRLEHEAVAPGLALS